MSEKAQDGEELARRVEELCEWWVEDGAAVVERIEAKTLAHFHLIEGEDESAERGPYR